MAFKDKDKKKDKPRPAMSLLASDDPKADEKIKAALRTAFSDPEVVRTDPTENTVFKYNTGILSLDRALGIGGLLGGRILDTSGDNGTGKTLLNLGIAAAIQQQGGSVGYCDAEGTFSAPFARATGLDPTQRFFYVRSTPDFIMTGEDYFAAIQKMVQLGVNYIIVDSCPALVPSDKFTKSFGEGQQATHARMMSEELSKLAAYLTASPRSIVSFINQIRGVPNVMFGSPEKATGGNALTFFRSYNFEMRRAKDIIGDCVKGDGSIEKKIIGVEVTVTLSKNKTAAKPVEPVCFNMFTTFANLKDGTRIEPGVDTVKDVFEVGKATGAIEQNSSWYKFKDLKGLGEVDFMDGLRKRPELVQGIRDIVLSDGVIENDANGTEETSKDLTEK